MKTLLPVVPDSEVVSCIKQKKPFSTSTLSVSGSEGEHGYEVANAYGSTDIFYCNTSKRWYRYELPARKVASILPQLDEQLTTLNMYQMEIITNEGFITLTKKKVLRDN